MFISKSNYNKLQTKIKEKEEKIEELSTIIKSKFDTPEDCVIGRWCGDCKFGIKHRYCPSDYFSSAVYYTCGKGKCKNFTKRKENE